MSEYAFDPSDPYRRILTGEINDLNGYFDEQAYRKELYEWCKKNHPITKDIYKALPHDMQQRFRGKIRAWATRGWLEIPQRGSTWKAFGEIKDRYMDHALKQAVADRKAAGWTDPNTGNPRVDQDELLYLIDPSGSDGRDKGNGQPYSKWTRPGMENAVAPIFGTRFTI